MYKKLSREELRIIREGTQSENTPPSKLKLLGSIAVWILVFFVFVIIGYLIIHSGGVAL